MAGTTAITAVILAGIMAMADTMVTTAITQATVIHPITLVTAPLIIPCIALRCTTGDMVTAVIADKRPSFVKGPTGFRIREAVTY